jgi:hypothetical protein
MNPRAFRIAREGIPNLFRLKEMEGRQRRAWRKMAEKKRFSH